MAQQPQQKDNCGQDYQQNYSSSWYQQPKQQQQQQFADKWASMPTALRHGDKSIEGSPSQLGQEASGTSPNSLSHLLRSIALKKLLHHGSLKSPWENTATIPDSIKITIILLNETKGALQQHLQLTASNTRDYNTVREIIIEYYRTTASFPRMQQIQSFKPNITNYQATSQGPAPLDTGAAYNSRWHDNNKGKGKGKEGHQKGKGKYQGKGYNSYYNNKGQGKGGYRPRESISTRKSIQRSIKRKRKESTDINMKGKGKSTGKDTCCKCGQQGHIAKNCRVAVYNVDNNEHQQWENDPTYDWYQDQWQQEYDQGWYNQDWS